jgi:signal transduction histidine kinase
VVGINGGGLSTGLSVALDIGRSAAAPGGAGLRPEQLLLAEFAHELRTPLAAITSSAELLADGSHGLSTERVQSLASALYRGSLWLQTFVENVLFASSMFDGRFQLRRAPTDLLDVLADARPLIEPLLDQRSQRLRIIRRGIEPNVEGDRQRLVQVFLNLLGNASRHAPVATTVDVFVRAAGGLVRVDIADRGPGIGDARAASLFEVFYQAPSSDGLARGGVGLGLAVVKSIIERQGGRVGAMNRRGGGARFWFELPALPMPGRSLPGRDEQITTVEGIGGMG